MTTNNPNIQKWLLGWMATLTLLWVFIFGSILATSRESLISNNIKTPKEVTNISDITLGIITPDIIDFNYFLFLIASVILCYVTYQFCDRIVKKNDGWVSYTLTLVPVILLGIFISTTGGLLNSPFSLATGAYLTSVLLITEGSASRKRRTTLLALFIAILCYPYIYLYFVHGVLEAFTWSSENSITIIRVVSTILLVIITGLFSHNVTRKERKAD